MQPDTQIPKPKKSDRAARRATLRRKVKTLRVRSWLSVHGPLDTLPAAYQSVAPSRSVYVDLDDF